MRKLQIIYIIIAISTSFLLFNQGSACTAFNYTKEEQTLVGRNMDWNTQENYIAFFPQEDGKFGRVYFGWNSYPSWYMGGMNDQGVMFAVLKAPYLQVMDSIDKPIYQGNHDENLMEKCMEECSSLSDVLNIIDQYYLYFLEVSQIMVVDRYGNSAILGGDDITMKKGSYQVVANFRPTHPFLGGFPSWRYSTAKRMLRQLDDFSIDYFTEICNQTHQEKNYPTIWSIVYDLNNYDIHLYHYHDYNNVISFNLLDVLSYGENVYSIPSLFEPDYNQPPSQPNRPSGRTNGKIGREYEYTTTAVDPNGNDLYYQYDWGDEISDWIGPVDSGSDVSLLHNWSNEDDFDIRVKAKDIYGKESLWSDPLEVTMPKTKVPLWKRLVERWPFIGMILYYFEV